MKRWMKRTLIGLGALAGAIAAAGIVGSMMPERHAASRAVRMKASPEQIWSALTDIDAMAQWNPNVARIERLPDIDGKPAWIEVAKNGDRLPFRIAEWETPRRLVVEIVGDDLPFGGAWITEIAPTLDGGARVEITEDGIIRNPYFRLMFRLMMNETATIDAFVQALGQRFGETPTNAA